MSEAPVPPTAPTRGPAATQVPLRRQAAGARGLATRALDLRRWRVHLPPVAVDAMIVLACYLTVVAYAVTDGIITWWVVLLAAVNTTPLLWRRRYPLSVAAVTGVATTLLALTDMLGPVPVAQLVATYTLAALATPVARMVGVLGTVAGVIVSVLLPDEPVLSLGTAGIMFAVAYALGTGARARRDRISLLEERARRLAEEQEATAARERAQIAREVHDILAHSMTLVVVQAEAGPVVVRTDPDRAEEAFEAISATAREALSQLRRVLGVLRADEQERHPQPGLEGLAALVASVRYSGVGADLEHHGQPRPVPADLAATGFRIVQEALTNTIRHAGASKVRVALEWHERSLVITVTDDGAGSRGSGSHVGDPGPGDGHLRKPDPARALPSGGGGLVGMRERVVAAGGELVVGPGPDGVGFQVTASLPLQ